MSRNDPGVPNNVRDTFDKICQHTKWDLEAIFKANHGGNFAAALIIAASCEALSRLLGKSKDFYLTSILRKGLPPPLAKEIAVALRNGLAHVYETKFVIAGDLHLELIVSWKAKRHCSVRRDPPGIYLNVHTMWDDLRAIHEELRKELPPGGVFPRTWLNRDTVHTTDSRAIREWRAWFAAAADG